MSIHTILDDLFEDPGMVLTLKEPRQFYNSGLKSLSTFRMFYFISILLMLGASLLFVNRFILRRMSTLVRNIRMIGSSKDLSIRIPSSGQDEFSEVEVEFNRMIDSLEQTQDELRRQSMLDPLTRLPNRSLFFDKLNEAIAAVKGSDRQIVLVFIDLDHFKTVNDTLGHDFGDAILKETAFRITQVVGKHDVVSRLGGDEFTILLYDVPDEGSIARQLSRIQEALSMPHRIKGHLLYNTASIGISIYPQNGEDADYLVKQADLAMFHVKETGRNNIFQYSEDLEAGIRRKRYWPSSSSPLPPGTSSSCTTSRFSARDSCRYPRWRLCCAGPALLTAISHRPNSFRWRRAAAPLSASAAGCCARCARICAISAAGVLSSPPQ